MVTDTRKENTWRYKIKAPSLQIKIQKQRIFYKHGFNLKTIWRLRTKKQKLFSTPENNPQEHRSMNKIKETGNLQLEWKKIFRKLLRNIQTQSKRLHDSCWEVRSLLFTFWLVLAGHDMFIDTRMSTPCRCQNEALLIRKKDKEWFIFQNQGFYLETSSIIQATKRTKTFELASWPNKTNHMRTTFKRITNKQAELNSKNFEKAFRWKLLKHFQDSN